MTNIHFGKDSKEHYTIIKTTKSMLEKGEDPKEMMMEICKPTCKFWADKLKRCEIKLKNMENADPEMSCMYPFRDWVTCLDGCVNPSIINQLKGQ